MIEEIKDNKVNFVGNAAIFDSTLYNVVTIQDCIDWLENKDIISVDTETEGFFNHKNRVIMLQISDGIDVWVIDTRDNDYIRQLAPYLMGKLVLGQNLKFDYKFLKFEGLILENIYDTFLAECILTNGQEWLLSNGKMGRELGLGALTKKYCNGKTLDKSVRNQFIGLKGQPFTDKQILYGSEDVLYLFEIRRKQLLEIERWELQSILELENKACLALADIEYNGLKLDLNKWLELAKVVESKIPEYEKELDNMLQQESKLSKYVNKYIQNDLFGGTGRAVNISWSSPTQMLRVFKSLGLPITSSSEKELNLYQNEYPLVKKFIDYKKNQKLATTYGKNFINFVNPVTRRVHGEFWQILNTFRVSCGGSKSGGKSSVNLQNLPAKNEYLNCFVAEEGKVIIGIDYAAQEARIAACGSKDDLWLATFIEGKDLHSEVCKLMFGITDDLVKTKPDFLRGKTYRDAAKTLNFGVLFGMSKYKLSKSLVITTDAAQDLIDRYFKATKQLKTYLDSCANYGLKNGYIRSFKPYSAIRWFPNWKQRLDNYKDSKIIGEITRASYNTPIQATGALMTKLALVKIRKYIIDNNLEDKVKLIHVVHDATYTECDIDFAEEFSEIQSNLMIEAGKEFNLKLSMSCDITIKPYWSK